jgi:phosphopantothenoylcysteine decarboxylase/phosphopantothenate--cysteine ligase
VARILLGITGGIAAYKACELIRLLVQDGHDVLPLPTRGAERFVSAETFFALARAERPSDPYPHLAKADLLVVAPLTAHTLARLATGLADDVLTEAALAHRGPTLVAPAMNTGMWQHPATRHNLETIVGRGVHVVGPGTGELAEGEVGEGRMAEPEEIVARIAELLEPAGRGTLAGVHVVVSAGGTREPLDDVRFLGNRSSGRMGVAVAAEAARRGAEVTLLAANLLVDPPGNVAVVEVGTAAELRREVLARADADVVLMAAAVADYRPAERHEGKRPKDGAPWTVELVPTPDIVKALGAARREGQVLVAFGAETGEEGLARKRVMLEGKNVDLVVYNDIGRSDIGFDTDENEVVLIARSGERAVGKRSKAAVAVEIMDEVERLRAGRPGGGA